MTASVTSKDAVTARHKTFYMAAGEAGTPIIFLHGWPQLSIAWRHQLPVFGALGFRAVAPDMRGYGRSSFYGGHEDYALEHVVLDMIELLDALDADRAVWVGHDWGAVTAWSIAQHHPDRCLGVAGLCVPYIPGGFAPANLVPLADRAVYPEALFPAAQWDYQLFYQEHFARAQADFETDVGRTVRALFRGGDPEGLGKPAATAFVRSNGGRNIPSVPRDPRILTEADERRYTAALQRSGFFGAGSWYVNSAANIAFAGRAHDGGRLAMPVLFLHGKYDHVCDTLTSRLADPMREHCDDLTEMVVRSGHWMPEECPAEVNAALAGWLDNQLPGA